MEPTQRNKCPLYTSLNRNPTLIYTNTSYDGKYIDVLYIYINIKS